MFKNYLTSVPYPKLVLIEDTIQDQGKPIFDFLLKLRINRTQNQIHYFVFQESYARVKNRLNQNNVIVYDFVSNKLGWEKEPETADFENIFKNVNTNSVVFIDSLSHTIYEYGLAETYRILNNLKNHTGVQQVVVLLHLDMLEEKLKVDQLMEHLTTLNINVLPKFGSDNGRIQYVYKKTGGKIIKDLEEYWFENDNFLTKKIDKLDPKEILGKSVPDIINPEMLSTFKISISEEEKKERDKREKEILPYLPENGDQESGKIFYTFDEVDDWDEEDPDDDLDI